MTCGICDQTIASDPAIVELTDGSRLSVHVDCLVEMIIEARDEEVVR
jgi:hypothetical protein